MNCGQSAALLNAATGALSLRPYIEVLEDPAGQFSLAEVQGREIGSRFHSLEGVSDLNFGYTHSVYWLRLKLTSENTSPATWLLEIAYPSLDYIDFYSHQGPKPVHFLASDHRPFSEKSTFHRNPIFPVVVQPGVEQTVYLRVSTDGSMTLPMTIWTPTALHASDQRIYSLFALYFGMLLALGLYNLLLFFSLQERIYLVYFSFVGWLTIGQLSMLGLGNQFLWPSFPIWGNIALPIGYCLTGFFGASFARLFLRTQLHTPRLDRILRYLQLGFVSAVIAALLGFYRYSGIAVAFLGISFAVVAVLSGLIAVRQKQPGAKLFLAAWSLFLLGVALLGFRTLNLLPTNFLTSYGMQIGSVLEMLLLSFALADRIHVLRRDKAHAQAELLRSKELAMEMLVQSEKKLEQRIKERTFELAEANENLRKSEALQRELASHDPLTGLGNRTYLHQQLELVIARCKRENAMFALLAIDLDKFKPVNDNFGHAIGDEVLIRVARRLEECVRLTDLIARVGGDEFVVVLEGTKDIQQALETGHKIISKLTEPIDINRVEVSLGASIGIALWPADTDCLAKLLQLADQSMYMAKQAGRGCCQISSGF